MKSLGVYDWYIKMPRCGNVEHGLEYFTSDVQKHIAHLAACSGSTAGSRQAAGGACISETRLFCRPITSEVTLKNMSKSTSPKP